MARKPVRYAVVDAFTETPFKGNPAAVCFLEGGEGVDDDWMQSVAREFNLSETAFLIRATSSPSAATVVDSSPSVFPSECFHLRWFTPVAEVDLCGHATLASAHFLLTAGITEAQTLEFLTRSGILTATNVDRLEKTELSGWSVKKSFLIELNFPVIEAVNCNSTEIPSISKTLNGVSIVNAQKGSQNDFIIELPLGEDVVNLNPNFDELLQCAERGVIITAPGIPGSGFDFISRFFCPKLGINEDPVTGSAHCLLAPYWSKKLGKQNLVAYQASSRGGMLLLQLDEQNQRVRIGGKAVTVMTVTTNLGVYSALSLPRSCSVLQISHQLPDS